MFCTNCGNQLPEGTRFCIHCGSPLAGDAPAAPVAEEPVYTHEPEIPASQQPLAQEPIPAEPVVEAPVYEAPVYEAPVYETPVYEAPVYAEAEVPTYADPVPAPKKKKKKTGLIVAIVLVVALVIGGGIGGFLWWSGNQKASAYDEAVASLEAGNLDDALSAFEDLGDYENAEEYVENITAYQAALKLLAEHKYDEATKAFKDLGDFQDSKSYVGGGVEFAKATYIMECAGKADPAALELLGKEDTDLEGDALALVLYEGAAQILGELGDYPDAAAKQSSCYYEMAMLYLENGDFDSAIDISKYLNDGDYALYMESLSAYSADATVLAAMEEALTTWYDEDERYSSTAEEVQAAYDILDEHDGAFFLDEDLEDLYYSLVNSLDTQLDSIDYDGYVDDWVLFYEGMAEMYRIAGILYEDYGVLEGTSLDNYYAVNAETVSLYPMIEESLNNAFFDVTAPYNQAGDYWYVEYTNDTGYDLVLNVGVDFYMGNTYLEYADYQEYFVAAGDTVEIRLIPPTLENDEWDGWSAYWYFNVA